MSGRIHELKTVAYAFDAVKAGLKRFEVRKNDRGFQSGDLVVLRRLYGPDDEVNEWRVGELDGEADALTYRVGWLLQGGQFGIEPGYCVFQLEEIVDEDAP